MKTLPDRPMVLACTSWGGDDSQREFDNLVDGQQIATQTLARNRPGKFFDIEYPVPAQLTESKRQVRVMLRAPTEGVAGELFGCQMLEAR
jgi:hypothetical protein